MKVDLPDKWQNMDERSVGVLQRAFNKVPNGADINL